MSKYATVMQANPPAAMIQYKRGETRDKDMYTFGVRGSIPIAQLVGYIVRVQAELAFRNPDPCDESALVIAFNPNTGKMSWFVDSSIPVDALVGTLEAFKTTLVHSQLSKIEESMQAAKQTGLIGPNGQPILKR